MNKLISRCMTKSSVDQTLTDLVWRAKWLRDAEPGAASSLGIDLSQLMVRAGTAAFDVFKTHYKDRKHWLILAGQGNNGGDGYIVAHAAATMGAVVTVWAMPHQKPLPLEANNAMKAWVNAGGAVHEVPANLQVPEGVDLIVDGLLGTGITGAPRGLYAQLIERVNALPVARVSIDVPSGLNAETGEFSGTCFRAHHTVTFICVKPGLLTGRARDYVGQLHYDSLGLGAWLNDPERRLSALCLRLSADSLPRYFGTPRTHSSHKGSHGRVVLVGGESGFGGAAVMAAESALSVGAGLMRVLLAKEHVGALLVRCPEAMCVGLDTAAGAGKIEASVRGALDWADTVAVGPGLGQGTFGRAALAAVLQHAVEHPGKTVVLDADALNLLPSYLSQRSSPLRLPHSIITPHVGEAARLLGCAVADVERDRFDAARRLANLLGGVCVLKGPGSVIYNHREGDTASGDAQQGEILFSPQHCAIVDAGNAGMATGGMGDVLTGVLVGVAAHMPPTGCSGIFNVACAGALAHSVSADLAILGRGSRGLRATELLPYLQVCVNAS
ncbi:unnamed protein product [Phytomonas sp. Hart1]|nr:unnamed protein product [Phytomonas sp. Hart1]|eukprot:CCW67865.1 unnamed protein product [Phytomonas sp. isolate Hart1]